MSPPPEYIKQLREEAHLRDFLHSLYLLDKPRTTSGRLKLLHDASTAQLDFTIWTLYYILKKDIYVLGEPHGMTIKRRKQVPYLMKHFGEQKTISSLLRATKGEKIQALLPVNTFHQLLWLMFNRKV
jgi:hypothetical protein